MNTTEPQKKRIEFAGWKAVTGGVLAGFQTPDDGRVVSALLMSIEEAERTLPAFVAAIGLAKAMANDVPRDGVTGDFAMTVTAGSFGHTPSKDEVFLRLQLASGGCLGFSMPREIAAGLGRGLIDAAQQPAPSLKSVLN